MPWLNDENRMWRERAREVAEKVVRPVARKYDVEQAYPWEIKEALAEAGLMGVWIPKEYGGAGAGLLNLCICVEELSRACGGVGVLYAVNALGSFPILVGGTEEQKKKYLPQIAKGEKLIAFCLSEKFAGSDAGSLRTHAAKDGHSYILNGDKKWTTNGGAADLYTVFATINPEAKTRGICAFIVEKKNPGFSIAKEEDKMGIRCVPVVEVNLRDARVPADDLLGGKEGRGFRHAMQTLDRARPGVAAQGVGLAQGALEYAQVYSARREQFGTTINTFQMVQKLVVDAATQVEAARQLVYAAAHAADTEHPDTQKLASMCKYYATDVAMKVSTDAVQVFGGYGFMRDYPIEKYMRDAKITQIYEGTNQVQRMVVSRFLVKETAELAKMLDEYIPREVQYRVNDGNEAEASEISATAKS
jgi:butyryl-CoA dehydrogenase